MRAVDTNVVVRLLTGDDPQQAAVARALFADDGESGADPAGADRGIWISKTVLLESHWVLHSSFGFDRRRINASFEKLLGLSNVVVEDEKAVYGALALSAQGLDFADALHVTSRPAGSRFVSFDRNLVRRATRAGATAVVMLE